MEGEIEEDIQIPEEKDSWWKGPLKYFLALILILLLVLWYFPSQAIKLDPEPRNIPSLSEVIPSNLSFDNIRLNPTRNEYPGLVDPSDPAIKYTADRIVTQSCNGNKVCHAKAIYYFIRDNFQYVSDPNAFEYVKSAKQSLSSQGGDCEDASILGANLLQAVGIRTRFVFIPGHVYIQAYLPDSLKRYQDADGYVNLDMTCKDCRFGELPLSTLRKEKVVV